MSANHGGPPQGSRGRIVLIDDEAYVRESLAAVLGRRGFRIAAAAGPEAGLLPAVLEGADAVITDLRMPGADGLEVIRRLADVAPALPVIVLTGHGTVASAVECMKAGAQDYLLKPADPDEIVLVLERALGSTRQRRELDYLRSGTGAFPGRAGPLGVSDGWLEVLRLVEMSAPADTSILLLGETGTGKEEVAKLLHQRGRRAAAAFVRVNCAAVPPELFESEFFGHRRGAFTGSVGDRDGRFRVAHEGTLFLDEIDALPERAQAKVLRVLQDGSFERVGDSRPTWVNVRLICATNADLEAEVHAGRFRSDLYYRINVMTIRVPPLRQRPEDVPLLAEAFLAEFRGRLGKPVRSIHPDAMAALRDYPWPGNVRELRNVIERGVLLERTDELLPSSLPFGAPARAPDEPPRSLRERLAAEERRILREALERASGVRRDAARLLGIDERNLPYFLRKHGLQDRGRKE